MTPARLTAEAQVLLAATHPARSPERQARLAHLLRDPLDWGGLLAQAQAHGVGPLLHAQLLAVPGNAVPEAARAALAREARRCLAWSLGLHHELGRLVDAFARAGVPVMPLKGPPLAAELYGDPGLRPMSDLDLLVRRADVARAEDVLARAGGRRLPAAEQGAGYHVCYAIGGWAHDEALVELHWDLADPHVTRLDVEAVWAAARRVRWGARAVRVMAPPDLFLYLCLHAAKDGLAFLRDLVDITLAAERFADSLPWGALAGRVRAARLRTPVYLSLLHARALLGAPVPPAFLAAIQPPAGPAWWLGQAVLRWRGGVLGASPALVEGPVMALLSLLWEDSAAGKLRHLRRNLVPPPALRARRLSAHAATSALRWYPIWMAHVARALATQLARR